MKLFELLDFHFKYGQGGGVKLRLLRGGTESKIVLDYDSADLVNYSRFLDLEVLSHEIESLEVRGYYRLVVTLDFDSGAL